MNRLICVVTVFSALLFILPPAWSYEEVALANSGTITGTVLLKGKKPDPKAYNLVLFPEPAYCGRISTGTGWRLLDQFQVAPDGGLGNAVVMLEGVEKGKPFTQKPSHIEARDCSFSPSVMVVRDGDEIGVVNMDPILHDVQAYEVSPSGSRVLLHRPLRLNPYHPRNGAEGHEHLPGERLIDSLQFSKGRRIFLVECGFHEYMQTWGIRVDNPCFAITNEQGNFTLTDVPPGVYNLVAWHAGMGGILQTEVAILKGETVNTRFEFDAPPPRDSAHTKMVENPHYDVEVLGILGDSVEIEPTHEVQTP
jgi:plastocyanin